MRILLLIRSLQPGGAERQIVTLAKGLKAAGHAVSVVVLYPGGAFERDLRAAGVRVHSLGKRARYELFGVALRLLKTVRDEAPELIYSALMAANLLSLILRIRHPRMPLVWTLRASHIDFGAYGPWMRVTAALEARMATLCDRIIVNSQAGFDHAALHQYPIEKLVIVRNGIDTDQFRYDPGCAERLRMEWKIAPNEKLVGLVGRIDPMKDHPAFLSASALLARYRSDVRFVCVGDGPDAYWEQVRGLSRQLGLDDRVRWVGLQSNMSAVYSALDVLVLCSRGEGLPNVLAEAMACGTPPVVTNVGDAAWVLDGLGVVVGSAGAYALAQGIETALEHPPDQAKRAALRRRVVEKLGVGRLVAETERVFRDLVNRPPRGRLRTSR